MRTGLINFNVYTYLLALHKLVLNPRPLPEGPLFFGHLYPSCRILATDEEALKKKYPDLMNSYRLVNEVV